MVLHTWHFQLPALQTTAFIIWYRNWTLNVYIGVIHKERPQNISQNWPSLPPCPHWPNPSPLRTSAPDYRSRGYWTDHSLINACVSLCTQSTVCRASLCSAWYSVHVAYSAPSVGEWDASAVMVGEGRLESQCWWPRTASVLGPWYNWCQLRLSDVPCYWVMPVLWAADAADVRFLETTPCPLLSAFCLTLPPPSLQTSFMDDPIR